MRRFLSVLESFNKFLNLLVGVAVITSLVGLFDYFNQHAQITYDLLSPEAVWIDESSIARYYIEHNFKIPDLVIRYFQRSGRLEIPNLEKAQEGKFSDYPEELTPDLLNYDVYEIDKKLKLESYSPFLFGTLFCYTSNCDEWIDRILPEIKRLSKDDGHVLELAILSSRRVESTVWLKNDGDLPGRNIRVYISAVPNLTSGGKGSILSLRSPRPGPKPLIEDYQAVFEMPVLKAKNGNPITIITRESPIFHGNIVLDYDTERVINFEKLTIVFLSLIVVFCGIILLFMFRSKNQQGKSETRRFGRRLFVKRKSFRYR